MARKGENIYKCKDGRWEGRYRSGEKENGAPKYSSVYGRSYNEVRASIAAKRQDSFPTSSKNVTFGKIAELWLDYIRPKIKLSTLSNYTIKLDCHILPAFGNRRYDALTGKSFSDFLLGKQESGLSQKYVADIGAVIKSICHFAVKYYGYSDKAAFISIPTRQSLGEKEILTNEEQDRLFNCLMGEASLTNAGILLSAFTGIRIGELCALKWSDFDLRKSTFTVSKTLQRIYIQDKGIELIITSPKSRTSVREIPIPKTILPIIKSEYSDAMKDCYLLSGKKRPVEPRTMQYRFRKILEKNGLPQVSFHSLRHMFATRCVGLGCDIKTLSEILGHSSVEMTLNFYIHSSMERKEECMEMVAESLVNN